MATTKDLNEDLNVGMTEVRRTLEHYNLGEWQELFGRAPKRRTQQLHRTLASTR